MDISKLENNLNHLIERNYDAEEGFKTVIENLEDEKLKSLIEHSITERYRFGHDLKAIMDDLNLKPEKGTSVAGDVHRAWMNLRNALSLNPLTALFDEAIRGETHAEEAYEKVLNETSLQNGHTAILQNHLHSIRQTKSKLQALKNEVIASG